MMIRSAPPSCAHLADRPVPAPAPITGRPWATCSRSRASASSRVMRASWMSSCSRSAIATAKAGSLTSASTSWTSTLPGSTPSRRAAKSASSASASRKGWPSTSMAETPFSGTKSTVGPAAPLSLRAIRRPSSAISSGVVRISVMVGLWT